MDIYCIFHLHIRYTIGMPIWDASQLRQVVKIHQDIEIEVADRPTYNWGAPSCMNTYDI